jgi:hypothetical protein
MLLSLQHARQRDPDIILDLKHIGATAWTGHTTDFLQCGRIEAREV